MTPEGIATGYAGPPPLPPRAAAFELRPLSLGEILDRTFAVYRGRFWLFAGLASIAASVQLVANAGLMVATHFVRVHQNATAALGFRAVGNYAVALVFFLISAVTQAATVFALGEVYLGRAASVGLALRATAGRWYRYLGVALWQGWSAVWVMTLLLAPAIVLAALMPGAGGLARGLLTGLVVLVAIFGGGAWGVYAFLRNALGVQACVMEELTVRAAMRRSKFLSMGAKGRIFVVLLIAYVLLTVAGLVQLPMAFAMVRSPAVEHVAAEASILLISFFSNTLVAPVALIGLSLVYIDQRVRKEAYDLALLLGDETATAIPRPPPPTPVARESGDSYGCGPAQDSDGAS
jgi:hypothetical protein